VGLPWSLALGKVGSRWVLSHTIVPPHSLGSQYEVCSLSVAIPVTLGLLAGVLGAIVLLEDNVGVGFVVIARGF
jgi:hypothetical protein